MAGVFINGGLSLRAASSKMVLDEGLDISSLPDTLKEGFKQLNRLEGQYRVTSYLMEAINLVSLSPRKGPPCGFCNVKEETKKRTKIVEEYKPIFTLSKVNLSFRYVLPISYFKTITGFLMTLYKVEVGSAMYKEGIRWTEGLETFCETHGKSPDTIMHSMVLHYILTNFMTLVMLIIINSGAWSHELQQGGKQDEHARHE